MLNSKTYYMTTNINTPKLLLTTRTKAALLVVLYSTFLMSLTSFAGTRDTVAKEESCCTTRSIVKTASIPVIVKNNNNTDPNAAPEMTQTLAIALQQQLANADDETNFHFMTGSFQNQASFRASACDALTDVQAQCEFLGKNVNNLSIPEPDADRSINKVFYMENTLKSGILPAENAARMFIDSDKAINQHFTAQYGTVVAR
jgi:hypothetical protein